MFISNLLTFSFCKRILPDFIWIEGTLKNVKIYVFLHLFVALFSKKRTEAHFPIEIKQKSYQCEVEQFSHKLSLMIINLKTLVYGAMSMHIIMQKL